MKHDVHVQVSGQINVVHEDSEVLRRLDALQALTVSLGEQLMALGDDLKQTLTDISAAVATVATEVVDLLGKMTPGDPVTQDMVDQAKGILTSLQAIPAEPKA